MLLAAAKAYCERVVEVLLLSRLSSLVALDDLCYTLLPLATFCYLPRVLLNIYWLLVVESRAEDRVVLAAVVF